MVHCRASSRSTARASTYEKKVRLVAQRERPVVLVHGLSLDSSMWDAQFDALAERFVSTVTIFAATVSLRT